MARFALSAPFLPLLALTACEASPSGPQPTAAPTASVVAAQGRLPALVKVAVLQDKTGSAPSTRTPQVKYDGLEPFLKALSDRTEVDFGVGLITDDSDRSLARLRVDAPPARALRAPVHLPSNPFERLHAPLPVTSGPPFEEILAVWGRERDENLATFKSTVETLLESPTRGRTDIEGALARADMMLAEPEARFAPDRVHRWAVLVTDGLHTTTRRPVTLRSDATLVVVNASGTIGALERLSPRRFESPERALQHILEEESR